METRNLPGFPGYMANERGDIIRPTGTVFKNNPNRKTPVTVWIDGKTYNVHRLVCSAWKGDKDASFVVVHLDGKKGNNAPYNLLWATRHDAEVWAKDLGHSNRKSGDKHHSTKIKANRRAQISEMIQKGMSVLEIARKFGISVTPVYRIKREL